jgi:hypothetical protein
MRPKAATSRRREEMTDAEVREEMERKSAKELRRYCISFDWVWSPGNFLTEADLTQEQSNIILLDLKRRADVTGDIGNVEVYRHTPVDQMFDELRDELIFALGDDTCEKCLADLSDGEEHDCE